MKPRFSDVESLSFIERTSRERIEISRLRVDGKRKIDIRVFRKDANRHWVPKAGVSIRLSEAEQVAEAILQVLKPGIFQR